MLSLYSAGAAEPPRTEGGDVRPREEHSDTVDDMSDTAGRGEGTSRVLVEASSTSVVMQAVAEERTGGGDATSSWSLQSLCVKQSSLQRDLQLLEEMQRTGTVAQQLQAMDVKSKLYGNLIDVQKLMAMHDSNHLAHAGNSIAQSTLCHKVEKAAAAAADVAVERMRRWLADDLSAGLVVRARACPCARVPVQS